MTAVYKSKRPLLTIEVTGGASLGRCYSATYYRVTSTRRLAQSQLQSLRNEGLLGYGQEFYIRSPCDGKEPPAGADEVICVDEKGNQAINPYSKQPYAPSKQEYFVYDCESRVDSSD